jgi:hypothetical protein
LSELGNLLLNPLERRKQEWVAQVTSALNEIAERFNLLPEELQRNDQFTTFLYAATLAALRTHQAAKLQALRNALVKSAMQPAREVDVGLQYLRYIDELSPSHVLLLSALAERAGSGDQFLDLERLCSWASEHASLPFDVITIRSFLHDLESRFLVHLGDLEDLPDLASKAVLLSSEKSGVRGFQVTSLGTAFLAFIRA